MEFINKGKFVFERSGLNQWNANGRKRDIGEIYIPIPMNYIKNILLFFLKGMKILVYNYRQEKLFSAKVCQENSKALMTNPNKAIG
jgi:hypothetical protein